MGTALLIKDGIFQAELNHPGIKGITCRVVVLWQINAGFVAKEYLSQMLIRPDFQSDKRELSRAKIDSLPDHRPIMSDRLP